MKLDPVYLLAPEPDTRVKLSRRALFGSMAAVGVVFGAGGIVVGFGLGSERPDSASSGTPSGTMDRRAKRIAWARSVSRGPLSDLIENANGFLLVVSANPEVEDVWSGVARLTDHVLLDHARAVSGQVREHPIDDPGVAVALLHILTRVGSTRDLARFEERRQELLRIVK